MLLGVMLNLVRILLLVLLQFSLILILVLLNWFLVVFKVLLGLLLVLMLLHPVGCRVVAVDCFCLLVGGLHTLNSSLDPSSKSKPVGAHAIDADEFEYYDDDD